jgi:hypothetical protein
MSRAPVSTSAPAPGSDHISDPRPRRRSGSGSGRAAGARNLSPSAVNRRRRTALSCRCADVRELGTGTRTTRWPVRLLAGSTRAGPASGMSVRVAAAHPWIAVVGILVTDVGAESVECLSAGRGRLEGTRGRPVRDARWGDRTPGRSAGTASGCYRAAIRAHSERRSRAGRQDRSGRSRMRRRVLRSTSRTRQGR